jgi:hypothetical protein
MKKIGRPPREPGRLWALVPLDEYGPLPDWCPTDPIVVKEIGSGVIRPDGSRPRAFSEAS